MKLVITGGHHSSALPVITELRKRDPNIKIVWVGHRHALKGDKNDTLEYKEITALGIPFYELKTGKFYKVYNPFKLLKIINGFIQARHILSSEKPDLIMSFGGYLAVPVVISGYFMGIPAITHEQTLVVGYANKVISWFAKKILVSWENSKKYFPKDKVVVTGIPLRESISNVVSNKFVFDNELNTILVLGGKNGSHILNNVILESMETLLSTFNVIHQCGDYSVLNDFDTLSSEYENIKGKVKGVYFVQKFIFDDEIGEAFFKSNLVVARSGAHTIAELIKLNKKAVLIPIPWVSHNEQNVNANYIKQAGLGDIIPEDQLNPDTLISTIKKVIALPEPQKNNSLISLDEHSAERIVDEIYNQYNQKKN